MTTSLADKVVALHRALTAAQLPHAFGGALALAWCTRAPRGTSDIDLNVFLAPDQADRATAAMPDVVAVGDDGLRLLRGSGQARLWWGPTPIDLFCSTTAFHDAVATRIRWEPFADHLLPFLSCQDLAVFKASFNRRRDWADLEDMVGARSIDVAAATDVLAEHLGAEDERIEALRGLEREQRPGA